MSKTLENLAKAFAGESQARNRYTKYASIAKKEGYEQISAIFLETAEQEREHASKLFNYIQEIKENSDPIGVNIGVSNEIGTTVENLEASIKGETEEYANMYPEFSKIAEQEGYSKIAIKLKLIAIAEEHHKERYEKILKNIKEGTVFKKAEKIFWVCRECGYVHYGEGAPEMCPCCDHPKSFYQVKSENY